MSAVIEDQETLDSLKTLSSIEDLEKNRFKDIKTVLVVLSSRGMAFDVEALRQKIIMAYPDAAIFFQTTSGKPHGVPTPRVVDLLIDLTGPGQRQGFLYAKKLKRMARFTVGRNAGLFRKRTYDRVFDEKNNAIKLPKEVTERERFVQTQVFALAGIPVVPVGEATPDRGKVIALELPPLSHQ